MKKGFLILIFLLCIPVISALTINYSFDLPNTKLDSFKCEDASCNQVVLFSSEESGSDAKLSIAYNEPGNYMYASYASCVLPRVQTFVVSEDQEEKLSLAIPQQKKSLCSSPFIKTITIEGEKKINSELKIRATAKSPFKSSDIFIPSFITQMNKEQKEQYFSSSHTFYLVIDGTRIQEKKIDLLVDEEQDIEFAYTPLQAKRYSIKIENVIDDCQCAQTALTSTQSAIDISENIQSNLSGKYFISRISKATCEGGDGCNLECPQGDVDCTCALQKGIMCKTNEVCPGISLKNWDRVTCCSLSCVYGEVLPEQAPLSLFGNTEKEDAPDKVQKTAKISYANIPVKSLFFAVLILFLLMIGFGLFVRRRENED